MERRKRKKQKIKSDIIKNAKRLFLTRGYAGTTLEDLSDACDIGIGTFYNYFNSKADVFLAIMTDELRSNSAKQKQVPLNKEANIVDLTVELIWNMAEPLQVSKKKMWKEIIAVAMGTIEANDNVMKRLNEYDNQFIIQLEEFFNDQKYKGTLSNSFPSKTSAKVIFNIALSCFIFYIYCPETTLEGLKEKVREQLNFVLANWEA